MSLCYDKNVSLGGDKMAVKHYPGETLGIIGSSMSTVLVAQEAGKLGYKVASLVTQEDNIIRQFSSWQTVTESYNRNALEYFGERVDVVFVEKGLLSNQSYQILSRYTDVVLSEDLMAMTTDRLIEKAYLDSHKILVAPFSLVTSLLDIKEAIEYIGFPAVLKFTQRNIEAERDHLILYSEEDFEEAEAKLNIGSCILESWIPTEKRVSLTVVRNERGEILLYPTFEVINQGNLTGEQVRYPANVERFIENEMYRIGQYLADELKLIGSLTLTFLVTSASVMYLNNASVGLSNEAIFTLGSMSVSHFEATVRAILGLPLPKLRIEHKAAISYPMEVLNEESVLTQFMLRTDWGFAFFNPAGQIQGPLRGQVIVTGESLDSCQRQLDITNLLAK